FRTSRSRRPRRSGRTNESEETLQAAFTTRAGRAAAALWTTWTHRAPVVPLHERFPLRARRAGSDDSDRSSLVVDARTNYAAMVILFVRVKRDSAREQHSRDRADEKRATSCLHHVLPPRLGAPLFRRPNGTHSRMNLSPGP